MLLKIKCSNGQNKKVEQKDNKKEELNRLG
jgi:hypothetical protein